jgi:hypothetical protein
MKILGMNKIKYIGTEAVGQNLDFTYEEVEKEKVELFVVHETIKYCVTIDIDYTICGSGWTTATEGVMEIKKISYFPPMGFRYKKPMEEYPFPTLEDFSNLDGGYICPAFSVSLYGDCNYYPNGGYTISDNMFSKNGDRSCDKRRVMIFKGDSGSGKSWLASKISFDNSISIYETDSNRNLPSSISSDIIVIGNKYKFSLKDIEKRIFMKENVEIVYLNFSF